MRRPYKPRMARWLIEALPREMHYFKGKRVWLKAHGGLLHLNGKRHAMPYDWHGPLYWRGFALMLPR
jgi:hypothetical protein